MKKILIIEDDSSIRTELKELLNNSGYETIILTDFQNALDNILNIKADLILLDINIPYLNGEILLQNIRKFSNIPVIMVTSRNTEIDEVISMSYGADDYITKPYNPTILLLRMEAIWKRYDKNSTLLNYESIVLNMDRGIILFEGKDYYLTKNEMLILKYFILHRNKIVPREDLMRYLWDSEEFIDDNTLSVNISRLRRKLSEVGLVDVIETRKGIGYLLK